MKTLIDVATHFLHDDLCLMGGAFLAVLGGTGIGLFVYRRWKGVAEVFERLGLVGRLVFAAVFLSVAPYLFSKGTNGTDRLSAPRPPPMQLPSSPVPSIGFADMDRGYLLAETRQADTPISIGPNAVKYEGWNVRGGANDSVRLYFPTWHFTLGDSAITGLTVLARGEIRPDVSTEFFPEIFDRPLSFVPLAKRDAQTAQGPVGFYSELTASNSVVLTWMNALYGRDGASPTNFQAELFWDGRFVYRHPDRECRFSPVLPFDWDGDGLENTVDPEPLVAGHDAHGTNAEWYNAVCSNVFAATVGTPGGLVLTPRNEDANTNAYYFVDVIVEYGVAPVSFVADGASQLGNPVIVARAGETNRVPLLIGATYSITSTVPFSVKGPSEMHAFTGDASAKQHAVTWQVPVSFAEDETGAMTPSVPADLQARLRGTFTWSGACCMSISDGAMRYGCRSCGCGGCSALVTYSYAGYSLSAFAPPCSCAETEIGGGVGPEVGTDSGASLDVRFDKPVVLFEDAYENAPGVTVAKTSTCSRLTIAVNGGEHGGILQLDQVNFELITNAVGTTGSLAPSYVIASNQTVNLSFDYEGVRASRHEKDIVLTAVFHENETGDVLAQRRTLTSVKVIMQANTTIPENRRRHIFGPREETRILLEPCCMASIANVADVVPSGGRVALSNKRDMFDLTLGAYAEAFDLELTLNGATLKLPFQVIYPDVALEGTYVRNFMENDWEVITGNPAPLRNETGVGCFIRVKLHPNYVSFSGLLIEEEVAPATNLVGYLADKTLFPPGTLDHNAKAGACGYVSVVADNRLENDDAVAFWVGKLPPWGNGSFEFHIPVKWLSNDGLVTNSFNNVVQAMSLTIQGTTMVNKYGVTASRTTNDVWNVVRGGDE